MLLIAGLGNPGSRYAKNRHNIGFMAADAIHRRHGFSPWQKKFQAEVTEGVLGDSKVLLVKPQTFMNESGRAIGEAMRFYKLSLDDLVVLYDELDLFPGKVRIKIGGGSGGHNGIRSIDAHCGNAYRRVRLGIGHPGSKDLVHNWVLGDFSKADGEWLDPFLDAIGDNAGLLVKGDDNGFMNKVTLALRADTDEPAAPKKAQSHIREARPRKPQAKVPDKGPMAEMLRKLLGDKE